MVKGAESSHLSAVVHCFNGLLRTAYVTEEWVKLKRDCLQEFYFHFYHPNLANKALLFGI
jgi:hypothetical protein